MKIAFYTLLFFVVFITACKKQDTSVSKSIDFSYCPLNVGDWITYEIVDINIDIPSDVNDTINYQLKEIIDSSYLNNNEQVYRIERYVKLNDTANWEIKDVWLANYTTNSFQKVEENIRFVKLIFPIILDNTWNGNAYNMNDPKEYKITSIDLPETINTLHFDSVLHVTQLNISNLIEKKVEIEKYAKNIGLVYKEQTDIYSDKITDEPIEERPKIATIYKMTIINYGSN
ncbi:MAG: hypothetical protein A2033_10155 [Bacteroidetes bacterium GWA2_31_9]|nr:MAG: hypothetical protein A2033_10155 [Bacteroidetes bacterium GWA2_31_9]